ncbi:ribonuclease H-like domain-containing protein, partial [Chytriomyces sp. MP71]
MSNPSTHQLQEQHEAVLGALSTCVQQSSVLATRDLAYHVTASAKASSSVSEASATLLRLTNLALASVSASVRFASADDATDRFGDAIDAVDALLEKADAAVDAVRSSAKAKANFQSGTGSALASTSTSGSGSVSATVADDSKRKTTPFKTGILRPQLKFADNIDNSNKTPFLRKIQVKHNAKRPLDYGMPSSGTLSPRMAEHVKSLGISDAGSQHLHLAHPYEYEINKIEYTDRMLSVRPEEMYSTLEETPFTFVDDVPAFEVMLKVLDSAQELAVDLEHHDYRSFQGFTCLIQISTRKEDFIVDALALRAHLPLLNKTFSNPAVVKVFHGAEMDIIWLQRDFGVYVVGLFDTYHASKVLELEGNGLGFLLKFYCGVETNKKYQMADWRVRPIPKDMMKYARIDTHYLLYIYDRMRNELIMQSPETKQLLHVVLKRSETTSLRQYEKEIYDSENGEGPNGWLGMSSSISLTPTQTAVFKALHSWRDHTARLEDESVRFVCPTHLLLSMAAECPVDL